MTVEYLLLVALFAVFMMGTLIKGPFNSFENAGPKLGGRIEAHLEIGKGFEAGSPWRAPE